MCSPYVNYDIIIVDMWTKVNSLFMNYDIIVTMHKRKGVYIMIYAQRIRALREDNDLKQINIAEILKTTQSYYAQYENEKRPLPIEHLITLCRYYNVSPEYILGFTDTVKPLK